MHSYRQRYEHYLLHGRTCAKSTMGKQSRWASRTCHRSCARLCSTCSRPPITGCSRSSGCADEPSLISPPSISELSPVAQRRDASNIFWSELGGVCRAGGGAGVGHGAARGAVRRVCGHRKHAILRPAAHLLHLPRPRRVCRGAFHNTVVYKWLS